ncbi:MAG: DUF1178 family protein [Zoogloeaceae bacterium]|nr:DUF1178 family protein [Zoogloeaceae bacterium]
MIVLDLECGNGHRFEGWFASSESFEDQRSRGLVHCPQCQQAEVRRRISVPHIRTVSHRPAPPTPASDQESAAMADILLAHLRHIARSTEDVGERFAEEARRIHHGDADSRAIRGQASGEELRDLLEEGIRVLPVPPEEEVH